MNKNSIIDNTPEGSSRSKMYKICIKYPLDRLSEAATGMDIRS